jgi:hypothetical protein
MPQVHEVIGFAVVAIFAVGWIWGLAARIAKRDPGPRFWVWLTVAQVTAGLQAIIGLILLIGGKRVVSAGPLGSVRHYIYGFLPLVLLVFAHIVARQGNAGAVGFDKDTPIAPWVPFAWAAFICFGLTLMALATGLASV